ncbi:hypothetical protein PWT90_05488 [Aphanocladium album]|nr:hypothetical protein PWT90_05488 [Aphanocladium album]
MLRARLRALSKMHLIFDFDGTVTTKDTIGHLASAGIAAQKLSRGANLQPAWDSLVQAYLADYDAYRAGYAPAAPGRTSIEQEKRFLGGLRDVELASLRRVGEVAIFKDLAVAAMRRIGADAVQNGHVELRPGFGRLVRAAREQGWPVSVVSVNWSVDFIRGAAGDILREDDAVVANGTRDEDGSIYGPAALGGDLLVCAPDKARAMRQLGSRGGGAVVYFGDSATDLECLVEADRGVVLADGESSLLKTLRRVGFEVPHVVSEKKQIVWARSFDEVLESGFLGFPAQQASQPQPLEHHRLFPHLSVDPYPTATDTHHPSIMCYYKRLFYACNHFALGPRVAKCEAYIREEAHAVLGGKEPDACNHYQFHGMHSIKCGEDCDKCEANPRRALDLERFDEGLSPECLQEMAARAQKQEDEEANQVSDDRTADIADAMTKDI